jgi:hypothetical protein
MYETGDYVGVFTPVPFFGRYGFYRLKWIHKKDLDT